ncbi:MAG: transcriptional activator protein [Gemmatimonadetes bacterium]|nr:transcriptional activator protein [Gemmatimonadota bacterium]
MFRLLTLGGLSLVADGAPVTGAASQRSRLVLLALLASAGQAGIARDKVLACLWPESGDESARHALKQAVYSLRRDLGSDTAILGTATLSLDPNVISSDLRDFDDAIARGDDAAAIALYTGPFLDGVFVRAAPEFDQWAGGERARLERAHLDAIERLARAADATGDVVASVQWWRKAAAAEPVSGRIAVSLMRALAESGDVNAAIQHARVHEAIVRGELDAGADNAVLTFAEELRSGSWMPVTRPSSSAPTIADIQPAPEPSVLAAPVVVMPRVSRRSRVLAAALFTVVLVTGIAVAINSRRAARKHASPRLIVVAAFENKTGDRTLDPFGDLVADYLSQTLLESRFEVVDARTSALATRMIEKITPAGTPHDRAAALAKKTGAATVITGSYYRQDDTIQVQANIIDPVRGVILNAVGPLKGTRATMSALVGALANQVSAKMMASADTTAGGITAALAAPPSVEAFEHASRGWEMFFARPADTTAVFAELARASAVDSGYNAPLLMRAYILDVKGQWHALADIVATLDTRRARMGRVEREVLALFEADLRGDLLGRLRASRELVQLSPGSPDMALLLAVSASYLNRFAEADASLAATSPERGINRVSPMYWAWRALAEHRLGKFDEELTSASAAAARFPANPEISGSAFVRAYAAKGELPLLDSLLARAGFMRATPNADVVALALLAARELRIHGHGPDAQRIFARVAALPTGGHASREEQRQRADALYETGDLGRARAAFASLAIAARNDVDTQGRLATIAARSGDTAMVRATERRLSGMHDPYAFGQTTLWRARLAALSGRSNDAITLLHDAIAQGYRPTELGIPMLHEDGDFAPLWKDQAFQELIRPRAGSPVLP